MELGDGVGDSFKDLIESVAKETEENFIYQEIRGTLTMHNEIIGTSCSMNALVDDAPFLNR